MDYKNKWTTKYFIPIVLCRTCKKWMPVEINEFENKKLKLSVTSIHCIGCEFVKNVDRIPKIRWVKETWLEAKGWRKENATS